MTRSCSRPRPPPSPRQLAPAVGYHAKGWWLPRRPGIREKVDANHRMLSTCLNALTCHHLTVEQAAGPSQAPRTSPVSTPAAHGSRAYRSAAMRAPV